MKKAISLFGISFLLAFKLLAQANTAVTSTFPLEPGFTSVTQLTSFTFASTTADKPQAKVWTYADNWWCALPVSDGFKIFRLDRTTWTPVLEILPVTSGRADCLVVGDVVHILVYKGATKDSYLVSVQYDPANNTYKLWSQRPSAQTLVFPEGSETATLAVDGTGRMWVASDAVSDINVWWSDEPYTKWSVPITIATGVHRDDICSITVLPGKIGVFWSNQNTNQFIFKTHIDGNDPATWSKDEMPASQSSLGSIADDHMSLVSSSDGTLYCAVKTSYNTAGQTRIGLLVRRPGGDWDSNLYPVTINEETQPIVILNQALGKVKVVYSTGGKGGDIAYQESSTSNISFGPPRLLLSGSGSIYNFATSTHQTYHSDIVILATNLGVGPYEVVSVLASDSSSSDQSPPEVVSLNRQSPAPDTTNATSVTFRITFSEPVTGVNPLDFSLTTSGSASGNIATVTQVGSGITYDVVVNSITGTGNLRLDLNASGTGIGDIAGNLITTGFITGESYTIQPNTGGNSTLVRGPYLQMGSETAVTLRWRTSTATNSIIDVGPSVGNYTLSAYDPALTTEHILRISGLSAGTKYYYRFGSSSQIFQSGTGNYFFSAPATNSNGKIRIAAFGDPGRNSNGIQKNTLNAYLNHVGGTPAELMLILGDNAYQDGTDAEYQSQFFTPYGSTLLKNHVLFPTPGNHDYHTTSLADRTAPYFKNFTVPTKGECGGVPSGSISYYSFDWGNIHFVSMDSYGTYGADDSRMSDTLSPQVIWVKKDLAANKLPWVIAFWHHPPHTKGSHDSDPSGELQRIRKYFVRILERYGVDVILNGHSHDYERSYLLDNYYGTEAEFDINKHTKSSSSGKNDGSSNSAPYRTQTGAGNSGTVYVVSGSSGAIGSVQSGYPHDALPFAFNEGGMFYMEVEGNQLDGKFIRDDGVIADRFTIIQNPSTLAKSTSASAISGQVLISDLKVYPTMVQRGTGVTVTTSSFDKNEVVVTDINGRVISKQHFSGTIKLKTGNLSSGTYFIKVIGKGSTATKRFVVSD
jgi:hypothetical protein